jgi:hypothetical protein
VTSGYVPMVIAHQGQRLTVPTESKILRIRGVLILKRNATRNRLDFLALADPVPYDLEATTLKEYENLAARWHD